MRGLLFLYACVSFLIGGTIATVEIWSPRKKREPTAASPTSPAPIHALALGLAASIVWPYLIISLVIDAKKGLLVNTDHCDNYIDDPSAPPALRKFLTFARGPGHGLLTPGPHPTLYADHEGMRVRVTMASRMGDVGITSNLAAEAGYDDRVRVKQLKNFAETP